MSYTTKRSWQAWFWKNQASRGQVELAEIQKIYRRCGRLQNRRSCDPDLHTYLKLRMRIGCALEPRRDSPAAVGSWPVPIRAPNGNVERPCAELRVQVSGSEHLASQQGPTRCHLELRFQASTRSHVSVFHHTHRTCPFAFTVYISLSLSLLAAYKSPCSIDNAADQAHELASTPCLGAQLPSRWERSPHHSSGWAVDQRPSRCWYCFRRC